MNRTLHCAGLLLALAGAGSAEATSYLVLGRSGSSA